MGTHHKPYESDASDAEWEFAAPCLTLPTEHAGRRRHKLREVINALRWLVRSGSPWRLMPHDLPTWHAVYEQARRWMAAGIIEVVVHDLRAILRIADGRSLQSTPESGAYASYDGHRRRNGPMAQIAVNTMGRLRTLRVRPADEQDRAKVGPPCEATGESAEPVSADQGDTGGEAVDEAVGRGIILDVVKLFALLPRRRVVERSFGWMARFRRLARDDERLSTTREGLHFVAFSTLMPSNASPILAALSS